MFEPIRGKTLPDDLLVRNGVPREPCRCAALGCPYPGVNPRLANGLCDMHLLLLRDVNRWLGSPRFDADRAALGPPRDLGPESVLDK